eukprot:1157334-Pelagomonas_calceolata.AAC.8
MPARSLWAAQRHEEHRGWHCAAYGPSGFSRARGRGIRSWLYLGDLNVPAQLAVLNELLGRSSGYVMYQLDKIGCGVAYG